MVRIHDGQMRLERRFVRLRRRHRSLPVPPQAVLGSHPRTEVSVFFESKPGSTFDLGSKPQSHQAYADCMVPLAGELPDWASGGGASIDALSLRATPDSGDAPLAVKFAIEAGIPSMAFASSFNYLKAFASDRLPANLIQAQRDLFGAHTYQRVDKEGTFHTPDWES